VLDAAGASALVTQVIGRERVAGESEALAELIELCGYLPLALRVAAGRLATRPHLAVTKMVDRLHDERCRLDHLTHGALDVRASIRLSYNGLSAHAQHLLRGLGDLEVSEVTLWVAAALLDLTATQAEEVLEEIFDAQLIDVTEQGSAGYVRFRLHDLVGVFAREQVRRAELPEERVSALKRALGSWLSVTEEIHRQVFGGGYENVQSPAPRWTADMESLASFSDLRKSGLHPPFKLIMV
jgi:hypothetical protein